MYVCRTGKQPTFTCRVRKCEQFDEEFSFPAPKPTPVLPPPLYVRPFAWPPEGYETMNAEQLGDEFRRLRVATAA